MIQSELIELFEVLEEFVVSLTLMAFVTVLSLVLFKAKNYLTDRLRSSSEPLINPELATFNSLLS